MKFNMEELWVAYGIFGSTGEVFTTYVEAERFAEKSNKAYGPYEIITVSEVLNRKYQEGSDMADYSNAVGR